MAVPLAERFLRVVDRLPEKECVIQGARRVTYGELGEMATSLAGEIHSRIDVGDRVAILKDNSPEYVAACYGTWLAGGVVVGLNTALKAPDLQHLVEHSGSRCLLADPRHLQLPALSEALGERVEIMDLGPAGALEPSVSLSEPVPRQGRDLAALIYTSGTTGRPKGVMLSHDNVAANTDSICEYLAIEETDVSLCVLPFYYSYGASVLHTHVTSGATLVLENSLVYPHRVLEKVAAEGVTSFAGVPSTFYLLLQRTDLASFDLGTLRYVTQAGGRMAPEKVRRFRDSVPSAEFFVMYGQTEASARLAYVPPDDLDRKMGSAGRAIPGVELVVCDEHGSELAPQTTGEVCARGDNVMMGYWDDPEGTDEVLVDGWLRTGDRGYLDEDGFLFLQGRTREMIKSGAHRISPAEIEEVIREIPEVEDVAVVGVEDDTMGQAIKACIIARRDDEEMARMIKKTCRERLPLFKVPKIVEFRAEFPRTGSGKIRKHLL